ncbi:MAG: histidine kinase [Bacteroidota bacterium]
MTTHSFVYSNNPRYRLLRHSLFWIFWIIYFVAINSMRSGNSFIGYSAFIKYTILEMLVLLSVDILFCYSVIYFLIPKMLLKEKYLSFFVFVGLFLLLDASVSSYFYSGIINPLRVWFNLPEFKYIAFTDLLRGLNGVLMMTGVATAIKFYKMWNIKKQELYLVKSEKISRELKFIDTYIQPSFLPVLLKKIYSYSFSPTNKVPEMLEKLQSILTYLIDECSQSTVMLAHEMDAIKDFIQLERLTNPDRFTIVYEQTGDPEELRIVPFILFPFVETNFRQVNDNITDKHWTNLHMHIEGNRIMLQVKNSKPVETSNLLNYETAALLQMRKRLDLLYPGSYKMNIIIEENTFAIQLEIDLSKAVN